MLQQSHHHNTFILWFTFSQTLKRTVRTAERSSHCLIARLRRFERFNVSEPLNRPHYTLLPYSLNRFFILGSKYMNRPQSALFPYLGRETG